jgi:hypothetical protein
VPTAEVKKASAETRAEKVYPGFGSAASLRTNVIFVDRAPQQYEEAPDVPCQFVPGSSFCEMVPFTIQRGRWFIVGEFKSSSFTNLAGTFLSKGVLTTGLECLGGKREWLDLPDRLNRRYTVYPVVFGPPINHS